MGAEEWRGGELHTCRMICHYEGVSSQLSPPNHPTYPASPPPFAPQTPLQPSKNTSCIPQSAPVSLGALLPHLPLLPTLYPERKCTPVRETAHWAHCVNVQCMFFAPLVSAQFTCTSIRLSNCRFVCINWTIVAGCSFKRNQQRSCELFQSAVRKKTPVDMPNTGGSHRYTVSVNNSLSSPRVIGHTLPLNAASSWMCICVREILKVFYARVWVWKGDGGVWHHFRGAYSTLIRYQVSYHHHWQNLHPKRGCGGYLWTLSEDESVFRVLTEGLSDT